MTLRMTLRDGEQMIVNGAVLRSRGRSELTVENRVAILRGREVMQPDEAITPARRLYLSCMMAYIDEGSRDAHQNTMVGLLGDLIAAFETTAAKAACVALARFVALGDHYRALGECRKLIDHESNVFARLHGEAA